VLGYAARGWHVFPLRPGDKRPAFPDHTEERCTGRDPRCHRAGRHVTWEERATTDPERIRAAWSAAPFGVGIACGPSGLLVADLDVPKPGTGPLPAEWAGPGITDGADVWCLIAERAGHPVPLDTYTVSTPSGGLHLYWTAPPGAGLRNTSGTAGGGLGPMVDTRACGGYVAAPPTTLPAPGGAVAYRILDDRPPEPLPAWLAERLTPRPAAPAGPGAVRLHGGDTRADRYLDQAIQGQTRLLQEASEGGRNHALFMGAQTLGQLAAGGSLTTEDATAVLTQAARAAGLTEREITRTITSGLRAGAKRPRTLGTSGGAAA
jgi:hypothetical protein